MPVFYYHPVNKIPQKLSEMTNKRGFLYTNRPELEFILQRQLSEAGYDLDPRFHTIVGSLAGSINYHIPLNPDDELDRHSLKLCKQKSSWSYLKVLNGKKMAFIMGYVSTMGGNPFAMTNAEMAQKGIIQTTTIPRIAA